MKKISACYREPKNFTIMSKSPQFSVTEHYYFHFGGLPHLYTNIVKATLGEARLSIQFNTMQLYLFSCTACTIVLLYLSSLLHLRLLPRHCTVPCLVTTIIKIFPSVS